MLLTEDRLPSRQERLPIRQYACVMNNESGIPKPVLSVISSICPLTGTGANMPLLRKTRPHRLPGFRARSRRYMQVFPLLAVPPSQPHAICDRLHRISVRNGLSA